MPETGSRPIVAMKSPSAPQISPLRVSLPLSEATKVIPSTASMKNSGLPKESTIGRTTGTASASMKAPKMEPIRAAVRIAPSALPASPFLAMGCPSTMAAAVVGSPGIPKSTEVMSPVVFTTQAMPNRKANASTGLILTTKGSIKAMAVGPPRPGRMPTANPMPMPSSMRLKVVGVKIWAKPWKKHCNVSSMTPSAGPPRDTAEAALIALGSST